MEAYTDVPNYDYNLAQTTRGAARIRMKTWYTSHRIRCSMYQALLRWCGCLLKRPAELLEHLGEASSSIYRYRY
jgi:hypothetical protein